MSYADAEEARLYDVQPWGPSDDLHLGLVMGAGAVPDAGCGTNASFDVTYEGATVRTA